MLETRGTHSIIAKVHCIFKQLFFSALAILELKRELRRGHLRWLRARANCQQPTTNNRLRMRTMAVIVFALWLLSLLPRAALAADVLHELALPARPADVARAYATTTAGTRVNARLLSIRVALTLGSVRCGPRAVFEEVVEGAFGAPLDAFAVAVRLGALCPAQQPNCGDDWCAESASSVFGLKIGLCCRPVRQRF